jgi:ribosomal protein S18 acetylase RimI-like enzyme
MVPGTNDPAIDATPEPATLAALDAALFVPPWNQQTYAALLGNPAVRAWVARDATDTPVAMLCVQTVADEAEVYRVGVLPAARRRGIARRLMAAAAETLRAAGMRRSGSPPAGVGRATTARRWRTRYCWNGAWQTEPAACLRHRP